ncbi:MAG: hypothetical protein ND807_14985 [Vicinamibacterales bacterium]|nr:hypothetical protein [Vicinamibacterales bacterium]
MVLSKSELISALQKEVRILVHLAGKIDRAQLDYRPTAKQRSSLELLRYLSYMGPMLIETAKSSFDPAAWQAAAGDAGACGFDEILARITAQSDTYASLLSAMPDADFRTEMTGFDGQKTTRGAFIVQYVLGGHAAYRTQLFVYLKACGREELTTANLWRGVDPKPAA